MAFDRYHLTAKLSEAIDAVHRQEVATRPELTQPNPRLHVLTLSNPLKTAKRRPAASPGSRPTGATLRTQMGQRAIATDVERSRSEKFESSHLASMRTKQQSETQRVRGSSPFRHTTSHQRKSAEEEEEIAPNLHRRSVG
jgi:hypothetical protein